MGARAADPADAGLLLVRIRMLAENTSLLLLDQPQTLCPRKPTGAPFIHHRDDKLIWIRLTNDSLSGPTQVKINLVGQNLVI